MDHADRSPTTTAAKRLSQRRHHSHHQRRRARDEGKTLGFGGSEGVDTSKAKGAIERTFSPEFRNRLDGWIVDLEELMCGPG